MQRDVVHPKASQGKQQRDSAIKEAGIKGELGLGNELGDQQQDNDGQGDEDQQRKARAPPKMTAACAENAIDTPKSGGGDQSDTATQGKDQGQLQTQGEHGQQGKGDDAGRR